MVGAATIRAAIDAYVAANNARDAQVVARLFVADARMHRAPGVGLVEGREAIRQVYAQLRGALARTEVEAVRRFIAGDGAACKGHPQRTVGALGRDGRDQRVRARRRGEIAILQG